MAKRKEPTSIQETDLYKSVIQATQSITLKPKTYVKEIMRMHANRKMGKLPRNNKLTAQIVGKAIAYDQSCRSTILARKLECQRLNTYFNQLVDATVLRIMNEHYALIPYKTKGEKRQYLWDLFVDALPIWSELEEVVETADAIIEDIDKAAWSAKHIIQTFELATRPELNYTV